MERKKIEREGARKIILAKHFRLSEFLCPCCSTYFSLENLSLLCERLERARQIAKVPFVINSGSRCEKHNREVGGVRNSAHLIDLAADIRILDCHHRHRILRALLQAGFTRIGIGKTFIHVDIDTRKEKPQLCIWTYPERITKW